MTSVVAFRKEYLKNNFGLQRIVESYLEWVSETTHDSDTLEKGKNGKKMFSQSNVLREEMTFTEIVLKEDLEVQYARLRTWFSSTEKLGEVKRRRALKGDILSNLGKILRG